MKKQMIVILTAVAFVITPAIARSEIAPPTSKSNNQDEYSWTLNDVEQEKIMTGMLIWGFFLAFATVLLAGFIPNSPGTSSGGTNPSPGF